MNTGHRSRGVVARDTIASINKSTIYFGPYIKSIHSAVLNLAGIHSESVKNKVFERSLHYV